MSTAVCYARTVYVWFTYDIIANSGYFHKQQQPDSYCFVYQVGG